MEPNTADRLAAGAPPAQSSLEEIGFSEYEARAYLALLDIAPANAHEVARRAGLPSSKIYQVLARLVERGDALAVEDGGKTSYAALPPRELVELRRLRSEQRLAELEAQLTKPRPEASDNYVWNINDYRTLEEQLALLVRGARRELILSIWREDAAIVVPLLPAARRAGVKVAVVLYGVGGADSPGPRSLPPEFAGLDALVRVHPHPIADTLYLERGGRGLSAVADGRRALTATVFADRSVEGAWSLNRGFVLLAEDYMKHDIYLMKIVARMDERLTACFGEGYRLLRDVFDDRDLRQPG